MTFDTVIRDGTLVDPGWGLVRGDLAIQDGRIAGVVNPHTPVEAATVIDATGKYVFPGVVDPHTHVGLGAEERDLATETAAAALGGVTTLFTYLLNSGPYDELYARYREAGERLAHIDFGFHFGIVLDEHIRDLARFRSDYGVTSFKFFMSFRGEEGAYLNVAGVDDGLMYDFFSALAAHAGTITAVHPENIEVVWRLRRRLQQAGREDLEAWTASRPGFVEAENTLRALIFAEATGAKIYIPHISGKAALDEVRRFRPRHGDFFVETCPHYLTHTVRDFRDNVGKVNPPLRYAEDLDALWRGIFDGTIHVVASDHVPRKLATKQATVWKASAGFPGTGLILPVLLSEGVHRRGLPLVRVAELTARNPAQIYGLYPRKGTLQVGADADLAIVDLDAERAVHHADLGSFSDYTLYEGWRLRGWPVLTVVRGTIVMQDRKVVGPPGHGRYLARA
jgi:dihydropyrimidinase